MDDMYARVSNKPEESDLSAKLKEFKKHSLEVPSPGRNWKYLDQLADHLQVIEAHHTHKISVSEDRLGHEIAGAQAVLAILMDNARA